MIDLEGTLSIEVDWEPATGVTAPELAATWCRLEIQVGRDHVTAVEDERGGSIRRGIYTSAYPLAEWLAENWWLLRTHVRPSGTASSDWRWSNVAHQDWLRRHNFRAAGGGMPWPDLTIVPEGTMTRLVWFAGAGLGQQPVRFITSGHALGRSVDIGDAVARFIESVLSRLSEAGTPDTPLQREWNLVASSDADENAFAASVARLGVDPFSVPDDLADDVIALSDAFDAAMLEEFLDSVEPAQLRRGRGWVEQAKRSVQLKPGPTLELAERFNGREPQTRPWSIGYAAARALRSGLGLSATDPFEPGDFVGVVRADGPSWGVQGLVASEAQEVGLVHPNQPELGTSSLRFATARALGLSLLTDRTLLLLDPAHSDLSKAGRAFAAEVLAPAAGISEYLEVLGTPTQSAFEAIASRFDVSPLVVQHQYENQLANEGPDEAGG